MRRLKIKDIVEQEISELLANRYRLSVYRAKNGTVVEVSFVKRIGPEPWRVCGCSYMTDQWTPSALAKIAALARARLRKGIVPGTGSVKALSGRAPILRPILQRAAPLLNFSKRTHHEDP